MFILNTSVFVYDIFLDEKQDEEMMSQQGRPFVYDC